MKTYRGRLQELRLSASPVWELAGDCNCVGALPLFHVNLLQCQGGKLGQGGPSSARDAVDDHGDPQFLRHLGLRAYQVFSSKHQRITPSNIEISCHTIACTRLVA